jgi:hypothetical protein
MTDIQTYTYDFINSLSERFSATLDTDLMNCLMEIKKHNKFIKRKSPIKMKYVISTSEKWRNERESGEQVSLELQVYNNLQYNLNKISDKNFKPISEIIMTIFSNNYEFEDKLFEIIFEKGISEKIYSSLYGKLIYDIETKYPDKKIRIKIKSLCDLFYNTNINTISKKIDISGNYDDLCEAFKEREKFVNGFNFISSLFNYSIVEYQLIKEFYNQLISNIENSPTELTDKYLDTLICILNNSGEFLYKYDKENFEVNFMSYIMKLKKNKDFIKPKYRFKLMDLLDLYKNQWIIN